MNVLKRRNGLGITDEELNDYLKILIDIFTEEWLNKSPRHPLQILWQRNDILATNELYSLSVSIKELLKIDSKWTKEQARIAKGHDKNNRQGAFFELFAVNMMNTEDHPVKPTKLNQAGFDAVLSKSPDKEIRISIKNYGISNFQLRFERKAKEIEEIIVKLLKKYNYPPCYILLDFPDKYPEQYEWQMLTERINGIFKDQRNREEPFSAVVEPIDPTLALSKENSRTIFLMFIFPFKDKIEQFHPISNSYTLVISAAYHPNEHLNLFSKIDSACANLQRHSSLENDQITNALFLHLPATISLSKCVEWLQEYFNNFPEKPISSVFLYQPTVTTDLVADTTSITHCFKVFIKNSEINKWNAIGGFKFSVPVGLVSYESSNLMFVAEYPDGRKETHLLENRYFYQHGEHYMKMLPDGKGGFYGNMQKLGSGVYTSIVIEIPGQPGSAVIKGRFPPFDELLIL